MANSNLETKASNLSIQNTTPEKYSNLIARLNKGATTQRDPNVSLNTNAVSTKPIVPAKVQ